MIVVGIDPGMNTGLAVWDTSHRQFLDIRCSGIVDAMRYLLAFQWENKIGLIVFEDARKRKWIPREKNLSEFRGRAMGAGSVKRDCSIWEEFCTVFDIPFVCPPPRPGMTKWTDENFRRITGYNRRTNQHGRDAALLVFGR